MLFLVLITMFSISAFRSSTTNLLATRSMMIRQEAQSAAQWAIEDTISNVAFENDGCTSSNHEERHGRWREQLHGDFDDTGLQEDSIPEGQGTAKRSQHWTRGGRLDHLRLGRCGKAVRRRDWRRLYRGRCLRSCGQFDSVLLC
jgi:hypothetical protein